MDKFSERFEDHKIPEWYSRYMDYQKLKRIWEASHNRDKKIEGFYICTKEAPYNLSKFDPNRQQAQELYAE
jgi:hypothetical protein